MFKAYSSRFLLSPLHVCPRDDDGGVMVLGGADGAWTTDVQVEVALHCTALHSGDRHVSMEIVLHPTRLHSISAMQDGGMQKGID